MSNNTSQLESLTEGGLVTVRLAGGTEAASRRRHYYRTGRRAGRWIGPPTPLMTLFTADPSVVRITPHATTEEDKGGLGWKD